MGFMDLLKSVGRGAKDIASEPAFLAALAAPAVGAGINSVAGYKAKLRDAAAKAEAYRSMIELHPKLKIHDQKEIGRLYNSLHNVNPMLARDPMVAGAWVDNIMESKGLLGSDGSHQQLLNAVKDLAGIRNQVSSAMRNEGGANPGAVWAKTIEQGGKMYGDMQQNGLKVMMERGNKQLDEHFDAEHNIMLQRSRELAERHAAEDNRLVKLRKEVEAYAADVHSGKHASEENELESMFGALGV